MTVGSNIDGLSYIVKTEIKSVILGTRHTISIKFENNCFHYETIYLRKNYVNFYYNYVWDITYLIKHISRKNKYTQKETMNLIYSEIYNLSAFLSSNYTEGDKAEVKLASRMAEEKQKMYRYLNLNRG